MKTATSKKQRTNSPATERDQPSNVSDVFHEVFSGDTANAITANLARLPGHLPIQRSDLIPFAAASRALSNHRPSPKCGCVVAICLDDKCFLGEDMISFPRRRNQLRSCDRNRDNCDFEAFVQSLYLALRSAVIVGLNHHGFAYDVDLEIPGAGEYYVIYLQVSLDTTTETDQDDDENHAQEVMQKVVFQYGRRASDNVRIRSSYEVWKYGGLIPRNFTGEPAEQEQMLRRFMAASERGGVSCQIIVEDEEFNAVLQMVRGEMDSSILFHEYET